jgi:hypothetical protein
MSLPTLAIPAHSTAIVWHLVQNDVAILDGPRSATLGRVIFDNSGGKALRLVKAYSDTPRKVGN